MSSQTYDNMRNGQSQGMHIILVPFYASTWRQAVTFTSDLAKLKSTLCCFHCYIRMNSDCFDFIIGHNIDVMLENMLEWEFDG